MKIGTEMTVFDKTSEQVNFIVMRLLSEYYGGADYSERAVENYLSLLFIELLRGERDRDGHLADELNLYFAENIGSASLHGFASTLGYSENTPGA